MMSAVAVVLAASICCSQLFVVVVVVWGIVILDRQNTQLDCPLKFAAFV